MARAILLPRSVFVHLGYACLTLGMPEPSMRTATLTRYRNGGVDLAGIYAYNVEYARRSIAYAAAHGLDAYRLSSDVFPLIDVAPDGRALVPDLSGARAAIARHRIHVSNHPSQFVVLSSPNEDVVKNALGVLDHVGWTMDGLGATGSITVHGGGVYGDRAAAGARLAANLPRTSPAARRLMALENDEHSWTVPELYDATKGAVPIVFNNLHWEANARSAPYAEEIDAALRSWPEGRLPELHYSEQSPGEVRGKHADFITGRKLLDFLRDLSARPRGREAVVIVEAKKKDLAIARAVGELGPRARAELFALVPSLARAPKGWLAGAAPSRRLHG